MEKVGIRMYSENNTCATCGRVIHSTHGLMLVLFSVDRAICHECGQKLAPDLVGVLDFLHDAHVGNFAFKFGGCPECGTNHGHLNIGPDDVWFRCDDHRSKWKIESEFQLDQYETKDGWRKNTARIKDYRKVEPAHGFRIFTLRDANSPF